MFDGHLDRSHRSVFYAHGPERAYVIPEGDFAALEDAVGFCSEVWNGVGALILIADVDGEILPTCEPYIGTRFLDEAWLHPSLSGPAVAALKARGDLPTCDWNHRFRFPDPHPTDMISRSSADVRWQMTVPEFSSAAAHRVAGVIWGRLGDAQRWADYFDLGVLRDGNAYLSLLGGQLGFNAFSPLNVSQLAMRVFGQRGRRQPWPCLWIFENDASLEELVDFWNLRSGADARNRLASVVGLPASVLSEPMQLDELGQWTRATDGELSPTLFVKAAPGRLAEIESVLGTNGVERRAEGSQPVVNQTGSASEPSWMAWNPEPNGPIVRGAWDVVDYQIRDGTSLITIPRPRTFRPFGGARLVIQSIPTPLPITHSVGPKLCNGCFAHARGVGLNIATGSPWSLTLALPTEAAAIQMWAADHGYTASEPPPGKDARALLQRLGRLERLDSILDDIQLEILVQLAPLAREQLARRLARDWAPGSEIARLAEEIRDKLRDEGLLIALDGHTLEQLDSALPRFEKRQILAGLAALVEADFVVRGRNVQCPRCHFDDFLALRELDERLGCRGCGLRYLLPVTAANQGEGQTAYRLDGLMARVLERHVLPVILTLRALRRPERAGSSLEHVWPGMLFSKPGQPETDIDLLLSDGTRVLVAECKLDARSLGEVQLAKLLAFAKKVGAQPVLAALNGEFGGEVREQMSANDGVVLERRELLAVPLAP